MMMMDVAKIQDSDENSVKDVHDDDDVVLPGFRFHPTDEELVGFYLRRKVEKKPLRIELIKHVDIYKYDPWDLPKVSSVGEKEWYFFCMRGRKYRNSIRPNRVTGSGFWKATGIDKPIYNNNSNNNNNECIIGLKKSLVYYRGSAGKGTKTDWMMHEFRLPPNANAKNNPPQPNVANKDLQEAEVWTLCRIFKRIPSYKKYTPNLKDSLSSASASASQVITRPNKTNSSSSKSCSLESDNSKPYLTFNDSSMLIHQNETKPVIIGHNNKVVDEIRNNNNNNNHHLFFGQLDQVSKAPTTLPYSNWNQEDLFGNENWDDLRSVVQFANDPSIVYDFRELNRF